MFCFLLLLLRRWDKTEYTEPKSQGMKASLMQRKLTCNTTDGWLFIWKSWCLCTATDRCISWRETRTHKRRGERWWFVFWWREMGEKFYTRNFVLFIPRRVRNAQNEWMNEWSSPPGPRCVREEDIGCAVTLLFCMLLKFNLAWAFWGRGGEENCQF